MSAVVYRRRAEIAKRVVWTIMIVIGLSLLALLYSFKTMAQSARKEVRALEAKILAEQDAIVLLNAEIIFLERPDRLAELSSDILGLSPERYDKDDGLSAIMDIALREAVAPDYRGEAAQ